MMMKGCLKFVKTTLTMNFYTDLPHSSAEALAKSFEKMYRDYSEHLCIGYYHNILQPERSIVYRAYAKFRGKEAGSFDLFSYSGMCEGTEMYRFYVAREPDLELKKQKRMEDFISDEKWRLEREWSSKKVKDLQNELKRLNVERPPKLKQEKVEVIVKLHLEKSLADFK